MIKIDDIDVNKILVSKKEPYGTIKSNISIDVMMMMLLDTMHEASSNDWIC